MSTTSLFRRENSLQVLAGAMKAVILIGGPRVCTSMCVCMATERLRLLNMTLILKVISAGFMGLVGWGEAGLQDCC